MNSPTRWRGGTWAREERVGAMGQATKPAAISEKLKAAAMSTKNGACRFVTAMWKASATKKPSIQKPSTVKTG